MPPKNCLNAFATTASPKTRSPRKSDAALSLAQDERKDRKETKIQRRKNRREEKSEGRCHPFHPLQPAAKICRPRAAHILRSSSIDSCGTDQPELKISQFARRPVKSQISMPSGASSPSPNRCQISLAKPLASKRDSASGAWSFPRQSITRASDRNGHALRHFQIARVCPMARSLLFILDQFKRGIPNFNRCSLFFAIFAPLRSLR
jgi:hypothetical protein